MTIDQTALIQKSESLIKKAKKGDQDALRQIFAVFIGADIDFELITYCGTRGLWGIGTQSFYALSKKHVAVIEYGLLGRVIFHSTMIKHIKSIAVYQPSKAGLYRILALFVLLWAGLWFFVIMGFAVPFLSDVGEVIVGFLIALIGVFLMPIVAQGYYGIFKCGCVFSVERSFTPYLFTNRARIPLLTDLIRFIQYYQLEENGEV